MVSMTTKRLGRDFRFQIKTGSTNADASAAGAAGEPEGLLFAADMQTAARGRADRTWFSPMGANISCSLLLRPGTWPQDAASLPLVVGLAIAEELAVCAPSLLPQIKWPNDILIGGKKICGILCEMHMKGYTVDYIVAGFGLNVNVKEKQFPPELRNTATSILIETGRPMSREKILANILSRFEPLYDEWRMFGFGAIYQHVNTLDALRGKRVRMELAGTPIEGMACGIESDGALLLQTPDGMTRVYSGEAHVVSIDS